MSFETKDFLITSSCMNSIQMPTILSDTDTTYKIRNFCYPNNVNPELYETIRDNRGIVFDENDKVIFKGFNFTTEYKSDDEFIQNYELTDRNRVFESYEGTLIRLFFYKDKWFITTHRKLDAFKSKWLSQESFGTTFKNALKNEYVNNVDFRQKIVDQQQVDNSDIFFDTFLSLLNKSKKYCFLIENNIENRLLTTCYNDPRVYHIGTFSDIPERMEDEMEIDEPLSLTPPKFQSVCKLSDESLCMSTPRELFFSTMNDLKNYVNSLDVMRSPGVIVFEEHEQFKVCSQNYKNCLALRGSFSSLKQRYIQLKLSGNQSELEEFRRIFYEDRHMFSNYEDDILLASKEIHSIYLARFIRKEYTFTSKEYFKIIKLCHSFYLENRDVNRVTAQVVYNIMLTMNASFICSLLKNKGNVKATIVNQPKFDLSVSMTS